MGFFEGLLEVAVLELIDDMRAFIRKARRLLCDGGLYFCGVFPNKNHWFTRMGLRGVALT
jgi:hypothetical protein